MIAMKKIAMKKMQDSKQIEAIKDFFARNEIPDEPIMLNKWTRIDNPKKFVEGYIAMIDIMDSKTATPYIARLRELGIIILQNQIKTNNG